MCFIRIFFSSTNALFFFQAEDGIRDCLLSRGLGDVYKRQGLGRSLAFPACSLDFGPRPTFVLPRIGIYSPASGHIAPLRSCIAPWLSCCYFLDFCCNDRSLSCLQRKPVPGAGGWCPGSASSPPKVIQKKLRDRCRFAASSIAVTPPTS